jgi:hypothetical protein
MRLILWLLLAFALSLLVSGAISVEFASLMKSGEEFIPVLLMLPLYLFLAITIFAAGAMFSGSRSTHGVIALGLAGLVIAATASVLTLTRGNMRESDAVTLASFGVSALSGLLVQWWVARRVVA